jgi:hypothetical protein
MSPTSISGGGNLLTGGELISPASLKGQEEVLPSAKLEQWPYNTAKLLQKLSYFLIDDYSISSYLSCQFLRYFIIHINDIFSSYEQYTD